MAAWAGAAQAAMELAKVMLPSNTTTASDGYSASHNNVDTTVTDMLTAITNSSTNSSSETDTSSHTQSSADPGVIAALKSLAAGAISNSNDPSKTQGLIASVLQQAGDAMSSVFGSQKQSGMYNSASAATQNNDIMSRAAASAASAVLGYQTSEQQIAGSALNNLLAATATSDTSSKSVTNTASETASNSVTTDVGNTQVVSSQDSYTAGSSKASTKMSVVCTWMRDNNFLSPRRYYVSKVDFDGLPWYIQSGYLIIGNPLVTLLEKDHTTLTARAILWVFAARTKQICSLYKIPGCKKSLSGAFARALVASTVFFPALYFWFLGLKMHYKRLYSNELDFFSSDRG